MVVDVAGSIELFTSRSRVANSFTDLAKTPPGWPKTRNASTAISTAAPTIAGATTLRRRSEGGKVHARGFGGGGAPTNGGSSRGMGSAAGGGGADGAGGVAGVSVAPHCRQNRAEARFAPPQAGHDVAPAGEVSLMMGPFQHSPTVQTSTRSRGVSASCAPPHSPQNRD
jgi:hypothetical protein